MKHVAEEFRPGACIIAFETTYSHNPDKPNSILRYYLVGNMTKIQNGKAIGAANLNKTALIIYAKPGDIVKTMRYCSHINDYIVNFYRIGKNYKPILLANKKKYYSISGISEFLDDSVSDSMGRVDVSSSEETKIFASKWPSWFGEIIQRHLRILKRTKRLQWWEVAGDAVDSREIRSIVRHQPGLALKLFRNRLDGPQIQECIERSMLDGILYAFDKMKEEQIALAAKLHAKELLEKHANELSIANFRICANACLDIARNIRANLTEQQHAVVMSMTLKKCNEFYRNSLDKKLNVEVLTSLSKTFNIWNDTYDGDYLDLFFDLLRAKIIIYSDQQKDEIFNYLRNLDSNRVKIEHNMDFFFGRSFTFNI